MSHSSSRPASQGSGGRAWGPTLLSTFRWGPGGTPPQASQPAKAANAPTSAPALSVNTLWCQAERQLSIQVEHDGASEEEILQALQAAAEQLQTKINTPHRRAA